jgi:hypothetical protein
MREASAQIRLVKKRYFTNELHEKCFAARNLRMKNFIIALKNYTLRHFFLTQMHENMNRYGTF